MKKIITLAFSCLCLISVYGQAPTIADGVYLFEKAELSIWNYDTKELIENQVVRDTASVDARQMYWQFTFFEIEMQDGIMKECRLADGQRYGFDESMNLQPAIDGKKEFVLTEEDSDKYVFIGRNIPPYDLRIENEKLVVTFAKYSFGQSGVNFTMEAELTITMTKQK